MDKTCWKGKFKIYWLIQNMNTHAYEFQALTQGAGSMHLIMDVV